MTDAPRPQWRFAASSTLRGIYVIRYFLFSGGMAILGALIERAAVGGDRSALGLLIGLVVGFVVFRGQLRPLSWPTLVLSQEALYLVRRGKASMIPWASLGEIAASDGFVSLRVLPGTGAVGSGDPIRLEARKYGTAADLLQKALRRIAADRELRLRLPGDEQLRRAAAIPPPSGVSLSDAPIDLE